MDTNVKQAKREMRYTVEPDPITAAPGRCTLVFSETSSFFSDAQDYSPTQQDDI